MTKENYENKGMTSQGCCYELKAILFAKFKSGIRPKVESLFKVPQLKIFIN